MDLESMPYYEESPEEKRRRKKAEEDSTNLFTQLLKLAGICFFVAFIYSSSIVAAYFLIRNTHFFLQLQAWEKLLAVLLLAYLISSLVFFFKGIMIVLRAARNWGWVLIWLLCFTVVCLLPAVVVYFLLEDILGPSIPAKREGISHYKFWSAIGALLASFVIYSRYGLNKDNVLTISYWAYALGKRTGTMILRRINRRRPFKPGM
jgi:magnesium-transporting ATPase (P-type)